MIKIINFFRDWISETKITYVDAFFISLIIYVGIAVIVACQMFVITVIDAIFGTQIFNILDNIVMPVMLILIFVIILGAFVCLFYDTIIGFKKK